MSSFENSFEAKTDDKKENDLPDVGFDRNSGENQDLKNIKIPKKFYKRVFNIIRKFEESNKGAEPNWEDNIETVLGLRGDEVFFEKLKEDANSFIRLAQLAKHERERAMEEQRNIIRQERMKGKLAQIVGPQEDSSEWQIRENIKDAQCMEDVKDFIKKNENNPEEIKLYWLNFAKLMDKRREEGECTDSFYNSNRLKNGILGEVAAERLLLGFRDFVKQSDKIIANPGLGLINFSIEKSTSKQDALEQADFFAVFVYEDKQFRIPVQVKNLFSPKLRPEDKEIVQRYPCSFSMVGSGREDSRLWQQMRKFHINHRPGLFIALSRDENEFEVSDMGFASEKLKEFFYKKLEDEMLVFMKRRDNINKNNK